MNKFKKIGLALVASLSLAIAAPPMFPAAPITIEAKSPQINKTKLTLYTGKTFKLSISGTDKYVMWKSSNKKIAKVSSKGTVTGVREGSATITATIGSGSNNIKLTCKVTVKPRITTKNTNIICLLDEYEEVKITFVKRNSGEYLVSKGDSSIADFEWVDDDKESIIRIIPKEIGTTSISVHPATGTGLRDFKMSNDEKLTINVTVLRDREWITAHDLAEIGNPGFIVQTYEIEHDDVLPEKNKIYTLDNGIQYKYNGKKVYYSITSLKEAGELK